MNTSDVKTYLLDLQTRIVAKLESLDGKPFGTDAWTRNEGGGGISRIIEVAVCSNAPVCCSRT